MVAPVLYPVSIQKLRSVTFLDADGASGSVCAKDAHIRKAIIPCRITTPIVQRLTRESGELPHYSVCDVLSGMAVVEKPKAPCSFTLGEDTGTRDDRPYVFGRGGGSTAGCRRLSPKRCAERKSVVRVKVF